MSKSLALAYDPLLVTDRIMDSKGRIRLGMLRDSFKWDKLETKKGRQLIKGCYKEWVNCKEYLWFGVWNTQTGEKVKEICRKCSKRGNDVYRWRLEKRLEWIDNIEDKEFFNSKNRDVRGETTKILFVSLTYDTKLCSRLEAWERVGEEWNRWITAVRRRHGDVKHFRVFEAHQNGYPHVHAILLFEDAEFEVSFRDKHGKFRILRKEKDWFDDLWHSNVDVEACYSTGVFNYIRKYMLKVHRKQDKDVRGVTEEQGLTTLSLLWLFRKQSFSVSAGMREMIYDLIQELHNSNVLSFQITLEGNKLYEFELISVVTLDELAMKRKPPPGAGSKWAFTVFTSSDPLGVSIGY